MSYVTGLPHKIAFRRISGTVTFFVDGTTFGTIAYATALDSSASLNVGDSGIAGEDLEGNLDELRMYDVGLSDADVIAISNMTSDV